MLQTSFNEEKHRCKDAEDTSIAYLDQIEEFTHKLTMAESKIRALETAKAEDSGKVGSHLNSFMFAIFSHHYCATPTHTHKYGVYTSKQFAISTILPPPHPQVWCVHI